MLARCSCGARAVLARCSHGARSTSSHQVHTRRSVVVVMFSTGCQFACLLFARLLACSPLCEEDRHCQRPRGADAHAVWRLWPPPSSRVSYVYVLRIVLFSSFVLLSLLTFVSSGASIAQCRAPPRLAKGGGVWRVHVCPPRSGKCTKVTSHVKPPITRAHASGPGLVVLGVAHTNWRTLFFCPGPAQKTRYRLHIRVSKRSRAPPTINNQFFYSRTKSREFTKTARAHACSPARPPSARLPARSIPACHFASCRVLCRGQSLRSRWVSSSPFSSRT